MGYTLVISQRKVDDRVMEVVKLFEDLEISAAHFSRRVGKKKDYIANWKKFGISTERAQPVVNELLKSAERLSHINLSRHELIEVLDSNGVPMTVVAERAGVSRQAVYKAVERGLNDEQRARLERAVKKLGADIRRRALKVKKELEK